MTVIQSWAEAKSQSDEIELRHQTEGNDDGNPQHRDDDGPTIQVLFRDTGRTRILGETAAEHIGQTAALALVHEDEQRQQDGRDDDDDLKNDLQNMHGETSIKRTVS